MFITSCCKCSWERHEMKPKYIAHELHIYQFQCLTSYGYQIFPTYCRIILHSLIQTLTTLSCIPKNSSNCNRDPCDIYDLQTNSSLVILTLGKSNKTRRSNSGGYVELTKDWYWQTKNCSCNLHQLLGRHSSVTTHLSSA